jgi:hypothetical protein
MQGVIVDPNIFQVLFRVCANVWVNVVLAVAELSTSSLVDNLRKRAVKQKSSNSFSSMLCLSVCPVYEIVSDFLTI